MEDLDYRITAKGFLRKQLLDGGFGQFRTITQYICWKRGKFFGVVDQINIPPPSKRKNICQVMTSSLLEPPQAE